MNIELYIANRLCDLEKSDLSIRLKRQFINPSELNTKDAQKSYTISLPSTPTNDEIFRYSNVEETEGKFSIYPDAKLYVNNILILEGKFRLTEITRDSYKGNLGVPAPLTAKDVFGEMKMNEAGEWLVKDFTGLESISAYNKKNNPECIFPYTLYSALPYNIDNTNSLGRTSDKLEITDFPPSTNCIQLLKELFNHTDYKLSGNALDDERLKNLYVSYRNPTEYQMPFNYKKVVIEGKWSNYLDNRVERQVKMVRHDYPDGYARKMGKGHIPHNFAVCNIFQSDNLKIKHRTDQSHITKQLGNRLIYKTPIDGLYKIRLNANILLPNTLPKTQALNDIDDERLYIVKHTQSSYIRDFRNTLIELKLLKTEDDEFDLPTATMDNTFYRKNQNQALEKEKNPDKNESESDDATFFQKIDTNTQMDHKKHIFPTKGGVNFIDVEQNPNLLCGFAWGQPVNDNCDAGYLKVRPTPSEEGDKSYYPLDEYLVPDNVGSLAADIPGKRVTTDAQKLRSNPLAAKPCHTWGGNNTNAMTTATHSPNGYNNGDYKIQLLNGKAFTSFTSNLNTEAKGEITQIIWLNAGENLNLVVCSDKAKHYDWVHQEIDFTLEIEPFSPNKEWLTDKMNAETGSSKEPIDFNSPIQFKTDSIDLMKFQPSEIKIDDWVSNFCKAFNLELLHTGKDEFELNIKNQNSLNRISSKIIDLDKKANVWQASNENMSLPSSYDLGFTINTSEQGYSKSFKENNIEDGGGKFSTGSNEPKTIKQTSNFSYCWYETLPKTNKQVPNLTEKEVWEPGKSEKEANSKKYFNSAQRFWYPTKKTQQVMLYGNTPVDLALVSNTYKGDKTLELNYEDKPNSIMRNYFMLLTNERNYTSVECFLSPEEYADLGNSYIKFNGDLYIVAEADGYDPMGKSKTKLKLIKKM